ncbi:MAG: LacI family DNA-binding transcriptional regulator [Saprospiraceae bacterium]|nr:LacI family DNA-binding transcriptional regulator [Saprospiraceae bacterium]
MNHPIRIKDIAERTGVSIGTVDRVLHNRGHVSAEVREKVLRAMEEMGYKPNILARMLVNNRPFRIACVLPDYRQDAYWVQPKQGVEKAVEAVHHYNVQVDWYFFDMFDAADFQQVGRKALEAAPDALLLAPIFRQEGERFLREAAEKQAPVIMINTDLETSEYLCYIGQESYQSGVLAGRLLDFALDNGDQALVLNLDRGVANARHLLDKEQGFRDYFASTHDKMVSVHSEIFEDFDNAALLRTWMEAQLERLPRLRGIFVTNSRAYKLVNALLNNTARNIKIVGFDLVEPNLKYLEENKISFLINQNAWHQGYLGILAAVNSRILNKEIPRHQYLPLDIVVRENVDYYLSRTLELPMVAV